MPLLLNLVTLDICVHLIISYSDNPCASSRARVVNNSWWLGQQLKEDPEMLSLTPQSKDPHPPLGSRHTLRFLDQAADPESLYWALRAIALDREGIKRVSNH